MATAAKEMLVPIMNNYNINITNQGEGEGEGEATIDTDKLSYEIFSILESKFLFGYDDDNNLWRPNPNPKPKPSPALLLDPSSVGVIKTQRGKVCILTIDGGGGGGMRGILPGKALSYLERCLKSKSADPNATISDYFDVVAGTGVGGLFAAMLFSTRHGSRPSFNADDTWRFLVNNGKRLFRRQSSSSSGSGFFSCVFKGGGATESMERAMKETFGEGLSLKDTVKPLLIPCYDMLTSAPLVFSRADALESESYDFRLWEVCRATWAEPGRFEPVEMRSVDGRTVCVGMDGGLAMSNPAAAAITHVLHNKQEFPFVRGVEDVMVLSLGCGCGSGSGSGSGSGGGGGGGGGRPDSSAVYQKIRKWGTKEWARPIARISSDGAADLVDHAVAMAFGQCRSSNYIRIQANGSSMGQCGSYTDCDPSSGNVKVLLGAAEEMLKQKNVESVMFGGKRIGEKSNVEKLDWFAGQLVLEHQRRSCRIAPTVAFKQPTTKSCNT